MPFLFLILMTLSRTRGTTQFTLEQKKNRTNKMKRKTSKRDASVSVGRDTTKVFEFVKLILRP